MAQGKVEWSYLQNLSKESNLQSSRMIWESFYQLGAIDIREHRAKCFILRPQVICSQISAISQEWLQRLDQSRERHRKFTFVLRRTCTGRIFPQKKSHEVFGIWEHSQSHLKSVTIQESKAFQDFVNLHNLIRNLFRFTTLVSAVNYWQPHANHHTSVSCV